MAEMRRGDVEAPKSSDRLGRRFVIGLVMNVVRRDGASAELRAGVATPASDELCSAIGELEGAVDADRRVVDPTITDVLIRVAEI